MHFIGKMLVVVQLVLTLCFMALAGAVFTSEVVWREKFTQAEETIANRDRDYARLQQEKDKVIDDLKTERDNSANDARDKTQELNLARTEVDNLKQEINTLRTEVNTQTALANIAGDEAKIRREESLTQRRINERLGSTLNGQNARVLQQADELFNREVEQRGMTARYQELLEQVAVYRRVLAANGFDTDPKAYAREQAATPVVAGRVLETKKSAGGGRELVEVSIGSDDGVREGTVLYVYRAGQENRFLGEIRLELVTPDKSVGVVISRAKNGVIESRDYVTTKL